MGQDYDSVEEFLQANINGRPHAIGEIVKSVRKSERACMRELDGLLKRHEVHQIVVRFNNRECPFYTMRKEVKVTLVQAPDMTVTVEKE